MPQIVQFNAPRDVALVECASQELPPDGVRVRTWYSGISAGTELTAYRGSNPYLEKEWDPGERLFREGAPTFAYPVAGWGYSEMGQVTEVGDEVDGVSVGQLVYGVWGHRSEAVVPASVLQGRTLERPEDGLIGTFARVGAIALNAVFAADVRLGDRVAIFGQGVIGLLATRLSSLAGGRVIGIDGHDARLVVAREFGADDVVLATVPGGAGAAVRRLTGGTGADSAIELSGSYRGLHEATRSVVVDGTVVASGFYQGGAQDLRLGEEFHHNRVRMVASQVSGTPVALGARWNLRRLVTVFMQEALAGRVDVTQLVTHLVDADDVSAAFERLDAGDPAVLQTVLRFDAAPQ